MTQTPVGDQNRSYGSPARSEYQSWAARCDAAHGIGIPRTICRCPGPACMRLPVRTGRVTASPCCQHGLIWRGICQVPAVDPPALREAGSV